MGEYVKIPSVLLKEKFCIHNYFTELGPELLEAPNSISIAYIGGLKRNSGFARQMQFSILLN